MKEGETTVSLVESLLKLNDELMQMSEPFKIESKNFVKICRVLDDLILKYCKTTDLSGKRFLLCDNLIKFTTFLITGLESVFPQEAILYCINNVIRIKALIDASNLLNEVIDDSVFTLYKTLNDDFQELFINNLVIALSCLCTFNYHISLNANSKSLELIEEDNKTLFFIKPKHFNVEPNSVEEMIRWILHLLLCHNIQPGLLLSINLNRLWLSVLKIISSNKNDQILCLSFRVIYQLLMWNCYDAMFAISLVDLILCREEQNFISFPLSNDKSTKNYRQTVDSIALSCLKAIVLHVANADVNEVLSIRSVKCSLYFPLIRRAMIMMNNYKEKNPKQLFRLAEFILNSLPLVNLVLNEPAIHEVLNDLVKTILQFGHNFFDILFEWKSYASLSSFLHVIIATRDEEDVLNYIRGILSVANKDGRSMTVEFYNRRWFPCLVCTLFCLSVNKDYCLGIIEKLFMLKEKNVKFSFTETLRERFLGILLEFRRSITDDDFLHRCLQRSNVIIRSLGILMENLDNEFFNRISPKLLVVLKATVVMREMCIPTWEIFFRKLSHFQMLALMPQILVAIVPLLSLTATKTLLNHIFFEREAELLNISSDKLYNILLVMSNNEYTKLLDEYIPEKLKDEEAPVILASCASMLLTEGVETYQMILTRILGFVNNSEIDCKTTNRLNKALLHALRKAYQPEVRDLIARCLGSIGAIDPDKTLPLPVSVCNKQLKIAYVDNRAEFYKLFLESCAKWYADCTDSEAVDRLCYCIVSNVKEIRSINDLGQKVWSSLNAATLHEIEPLKINAFLTDSLPSFHFEFKLPLIENVNSLYEWVRHLYYFAAKDIVDKTLQKLFLSVLHVKDSRATTFMSEMFPQILLQAIIENNVVLVKQFRNEAISVFHAVLKRNSEWIGLTNQTLFCILDFLEKFLVQRVCTDFSNISANEYVNKQVADVLQSILSELQSAGSEDAGIPLCVLAAEKCNCYFRAVRWIEQYGIQDPVKKSLVVSQFKREPFYHLERLYINLDEMDGVLGAFSTIQNHVTPTPTEQILALEATGNYADALPLCQSIKGQEVALIKCLLRLNQPYLARNNVEHLMRKFNTVDPKLKETLIDLQMEATCRLGDWSQLEVIHQEYFKNMVPTNSSSDIKLNASSSTTEITEQAIQSNHSWGARLAAIICSLKQFDRKAFDEHIRNTRNSLINSVLAMTFESAESYSQVYKYIVRLHALREIEETKKVIFNPSGKNCTVEALMNKWEARSEACKSINFLEPIIAVRRELLRVTNLPGTKEAQCKLLLQSSRISRRSGHLQTAWTFLVEARATEVKNIHIDMEESRYLFQKKEQAQAINILQKSIESNFPEMFAEFNKALRNNKVGVNQSLFGDFAKRKPFVEAYLLLAEFLEKASANRFDALLCIYQSLEKCGEDSEVFLYHYAVFFDRYCESIKEVDDDMIFNLITLYGAVLKQGQKYLQHVMPKMLTVWLDWNPKFQKPKDTAALKLPRVTAQRKSSTRDINAKMRENFTELNSYYFYTCFSQLISRITHSNAAVFKTLKQILSDLIVAYPHQCLWRSIAISRSSQSKFRRDRCLEVYELAKKRCVNVDLSLLINQYTFLAESLIRIAEHPGKKATSASEAFPFLTKFFENGAMSNETGGSSSGTSLNNRRLSSSLRKSGINSTSSSAPQLVLPFFDEIMELNQNHSNDLVRSVGLHGREGNGIDYSAQTCCSQIEVVETRKQNIVDNSVYRFKEVYIKGVANDYEVLLSMAAPKRLTFIGTDGKKYPLLCKAGDELRKDTRFIDVSRMLNSLFKRDTEARRRQLFVRCYSVIPLQEAGGIIEWVPNLCTMAGLIRPLIKERVKPIPVAELQRMSDSRLSDDERLKYFREVMCPRNPVVLAEWFRKKFQDACQWYNARLAFTRSAATMSIIGFVFGLGDRHAENILIDTTTGEVMHVDFNILFNKGEFLRVPEIVPFRLTRNMVNAFGPTGVEGAFRRSSETVMRVIRNEQCMLVTVLQAFVHDPLMEWTVAESRNQQSKQFGGSALQTTIECQEAHDNLELIRLRLAGNIVTARFQKRKDSLEMSVEGQVAKLIDMAIDEANLSKMYIGWNAFL